MVEKRQRDGSSRCACVRSSTSPLRQRGPGSASPLRQRRPNRLGPHALDFGQRPNLRHADSAFVISDDRNTLECRSSGGRVWLSGWRLSMITFGEDSPATVSDGKPFALKDTITVLGIAVNGGGAWRRRSMLVNEPPWLSVQ